MTSVFERVAYQVTKKYGPKLSIPSKLNKFVPAARLLLSGDLNGAANRLFDQLLGPVFGLGGDVNLKGGITLAEAEAIFDQCVATDYAKKNLWHLSVSNISAGAAPDVNMFATNVSYSPHTLAGDAVRVGSGTFSTKQGKERVEMRISTYDDDAGSIKRWFRELSENAAHLDGTFGLPIDYLIKVTVTHAYVVEGIGNAYTDTYILEPGSMETELDRRDDGLQEIQMTFVQFDSFSNLV